MSSSKYILRDRVRNIFETVEYASEPFVNSQRFETSKPKQDYMKYKFDPKITDPKITTLDETEEEINEPYDSTAEASKVHFDLTCTDRKDNDWIHTITREDTEDEYFLKYKNLQEGKRTYDFKHYTHTLFDENKKYLIIENYTSVLYEQCEEKLNVIIANKVIPEGLIEVQIKGKEHYMIPCKYNVKTHIISCFLPALKVGIYHLTFFINKEMMFIKFLRSNYELSQNGKSLSVHVIEINDFASSVKTDRIGKINSKKYVLGLDNSAYTNKELVQLYNEIYKEYRKKIGRRDGIVTIGNTYTLNETKQINFYNFLQCYKNEFVNHSFAKQKSLDINTINFMSVMNMESCVEQQRIPFLYKRMLYDHCIYENKKILMHFHSHIFEYDPFQLLSVHIFTKEKLTSGYTVFAFDLLPITDESKGNNFPASSLNSILYRSIGTGSDMTLNANEIPITLKDEKGGMHNEVVNFMSTLSIYKTKETNCVDVRMWEFIETITCRKNRKSQQFYIDKNNYEHTECPIPKELINNKNIFKRYPDGLKISEHISIFFEPWNDDILPIKKFVNLFGTIIPYKKIQEVCKLIKEVNPDFLLFDEFPEHCKMEKENKEPSSYDDKNETNSENPSIGYKRKEEDHKKREHTKIMNHLINTYVSFALIVDGKIYVSVVPISKLLLLFIINLWMYFIDLKKQVV